MEAAAQPAPTGLPLRRRLWRAGLIAVLLGLWAPVKVVWEQGIDREQDFLRYRGATVSRQLRDEIGQGLTIGILSGMRSVVADLLWLNVEIAWENQDWFKMGGYINLCTSLQPRATVFWVMGGWQLAYNASIDARDNNIAQPNELRRLKASQFWMQRGLDVYLRGIENNPSYWRLYVEVAQLNQQRLKNYPMAARYYLEASQQPNAPIYLERFPAIMYGLAHDDQDAYDSWRDLWLRLTPAQREEKQHWKEKIESNIRSLEEKLSIPKEKRVFPN